MEKQVSKSFDRFEKSRSVSVYVRKDPKELWSENNILKYPEVSFEVTKVHHIFHKSQPRVLKLTKQGILNCKPDGVTVTKGFEYANVKSVDLIDLNNFEISYFTDHTFHYQSPVSVQITQELSVRLLSMKNQKESTPIDQANEFNKKYTYLMKYTNEIIEKSKDLKNYMDGEPSLLENRNNISTYSDMGLKKYFGSFDQSRFIIRVDKIAFVGQQPELYTVNAFIHSFPHLEKETEHVIPRVRQFMNGLRNYMSQSRATDYTVLIEELKFVYDLDESITFEYLIESSLERALIIPLKEKLDKHIFKVSQDKDKIINDKIDFLKYRPQEYMGISDKFVSDNGWIPAIKMLSTLTRAQTPSECLLILLNTAHEIYKEHAFHQNAKQKKLVLSGDEILPIFTYVTTRANLKNAFQICEFILGLGCPNELSGEHGYYLTVFNGAINNISTWDINLEQN